MSHDIFTKLFSLCFYKLLSYLRIPPKFRFPPISFHLSARIAFPGSADFGAYALHIQLKKMVWLCSGYVKFSNFYTGFWKNERAILSEIKRILSAILLQAKFIIKMPTRPLRSMLSDIRKRKKKLTLNHAKPKSTPNTQRHHEDIHLGGVF